VSAESAAALADGVADREPGPLTVLRLVEPVAADVVCRQHRAGELGTLDAGYPRRQQQVLELAGGGRRPSPTGTRDHIRVADRELERRRGVDRELLQRCRRGALHDQHRDRAMA